MHGKAYYVLILLLIAAVGGVMVSRNRVSQTDKPGGTAGPIFQDISALDAQKLIQSNAGNANFVILDVRTPEEYEAGHIEGALLLDFYEADFRSKLRQLDRSKTYLVYCRSGNRSGQTLRIMEKDGFNQAYNMLGGFTAWKQQGLPVSY